MPGGRPKGSANKNKQALIALLQKQYPDYQPVVEMAQSAMEISRLAKEAKDDADLWSQASTAHEKVAQYVTPKLKAIEHSAAEGELVVVNVNEFTGKQLQITPVPVKSIADLEAELAERKKEIERKKRVVYGETTTPHFDKPDE